MSDPVDRRPLASRGTRWAQSLARAVARTGLTPNAISMLSMAFAALAALGFWLGGTGEGTASRIAWLLLGALGCQLRLLCNLLDGMVAVEGGRGAPDGPFWNEVPDRVADVLIMVGIGLGAGWPSLGWAAGALAVGTAYLRELGRANGLGSDFGGPMAKPQRMAAATLAGIIAAAALAILGVDGDGWTDDPAVLVLRVELALVVAGTLVTLVLRAARQLRALRGRGRT